MQGSTPLQLTCLLKNLPLCLMIGDVTRSSGDRSADMTVAQQARDAASIIKVMGVEKAIVLGRSGGAIIGLELGAARPEVIDFLIVHEVPVIELLPDSNAQRWRT